jgi:hypothetical protein
VKFIMVAPIDYSGQKNVHCAVVNHIINRDGSDILLQILNIVPFIGPLHISLNSQESVFWFTQNSCQKTQTLSN